ncbi:MAG: hypothetical protein AAGA03_12855 [Planctomycetota bacterium]
MTHIPFVCIRTLPAVVFALAVFLTHRALPAQDVESSTGEPPIADLLVNDQGKPITSASQWPQRRSQLLQLAIDHVYGQMPDQVKDPEVLKISTRQVMDGAATETLMVLLIRDRGQTVPIRMGLLRPNTDQPCPVIIKNDRWVFDLSGMPEGRKKRQYTDQHRDQIYRDVSRVAIDRGYAICKFVREDAAVDRHDSKQTGVLAVYPEYSWGAIAAWAWTYSPIIDHLIAHHSIDAARIISTGHSRGGKTALAAAILDQRISIAAPSASGSGGTGSWKHFTPGGRRQSAKVITQNHSFWFSPKMPDVSERAPVLNGHVLQALVAPRAILNTHGADDPLANPRGTRMMFEAAEPVYQLLGRPNQNATHWRPGVHGHTLEDWQAILDFADAHFAGEPLPDRFNNWPEGY